MYIAGQRRLLAPRNRVWEALHDRVVLDRCLPPARKLARISADAFEPADPSQATIHISQEEAPASLSLQAGGSHAKLNLREDGYAASLLNYSFESPTGDAELTGAAIDRFLDALQYEVAGPPEVVADGTGGVQATLTSGAVAPTRASLRLGGLPLVVWLGGAVYLVIFAWLVSPYL